MSADSVHQFAARPTYQPESTAQFARVLRRQSPSQQVVHRRQITTRLPTKKYRKSGQSASSIVNQAIEAYNEAEAAESPPQRLLEMLDDILRLVRDVNKSKAPEVRALGDEVHRELRRLQEATVTEVMDLARRRAAAQADDAGLELAPEDLDYVRSREVSLGLNPLKRTAGAGDGSVGDALAATGQLMNVHQTGQSDFGSGGDSTKRLVAEVGMFYPTRHRRDSFGRTSEGNQSETKGIAVRPAASALPKYAAINLANSPFGAIADNGGQYLPLHFVVKGDVVRERTTFTSSDSLREWRPYESGFNRLTSAGRVRNAAHVPADDQAWGMGPVGTGDSDLAHVLAGHRVGSYREGHSTTNPPDYVEAQIHGSLRIGQDISKVRANFAVLFGNPRFRRLLRLLQATGVPIVWFYATADHKEPFQVDSAEADGAVLARAWKVAEKIWKRSDAVLSRTNPDQIDMIRNAGLLTTHGKGELLRLWTSLAPRAPHGDPESMTDITGEVIDDSGDDSVEYVGRSGFQRGHQAEVIAAALLWRNNCLINAIALGAGRGAATEAELVDIRTRLGNVGEMMVASPQTVDVIRRVLGIDRPIRVHYPGGPAERFRGTGRVIEVWHTGQAHFVHERPPAVRSGEDLGDSSED